MQLSPFRTTALNGAIRAGDSGRYNVNIDEDKDDIFQETQERLEAETISFPHKEVPTSKGRNLYLLEDYHSVLALRATAHSLNKAFGVKTADRNNIIRGVMDTLFDSTPAFLVRCDISSFFENVNIAPIINDVHASTKIHPHVKTVISGLQNASLLDATKRGVPRGIGLSTTLSEIALLQFDASVRTLPGVYRYFRFADDMIIFTTKEPGDLIETAETMLGPTLEFNKKKTYPIKLASIKHTNEKPCNEPDTEFSYLGYKFRCSNGIRTRKSRSVTVSISTNKISDRKTRVILALKEFKKTKNASLLIDRIRFLTSNYAVRKSRHTHGSRKAATMTGIYYNYSLCGTYEHGRKGPERKRADPDELKALDGFLNSILWGKNSDFRSAIDSRLSADQIKELRQLSFYKGFTEKMTVRFTRSQVYEIRKAWRYA